MGIWNQMICLMENGSSVIYLYKAERDREQVPQKIKFSYLKPLWFFACVSFVQLCVKNSMNTAQYADFFGGSRGLMDRALDLKPEVTRGCGFRILALAGSVHDWGETLEQGTEPGRRNVGCPLLQVCTWLKWLNAENTFHWLYYTLYNCCMWQIKLI